MTGRYLWRLADFSQRWVFRVFWSYRTVKNQMQYLLFTKFYLAQCSQWSRVGGPLCFSPSLIIIQATLGSIKGCLAMKYVQYQSVSIYIRFLAIVLTLADTFCYNFSIFLTKYRHCFSQYYNIHSNLQLGSLFLLLSFYLLSSYSIKCALIVPYSIFFIKIQSSHSGKISNTNQFNLIIASIVSKFLLFFIKYPMPINALPTRNWILRSTIPRSIVLQQRRILPIWKSPQALTSSMKNMSILPQQRRWLGFLRLCQAIFVRIYEIWDSSMFRHEVAFFRRWSLVKYRMRTSFIIYRDCSQDLLRARLKLELFILLNGLTSTTAEQNTKKSWILLSLNGANSDFTLIISSEDRILVSEVEELLSRREVFNELLLNQKKNGQRGQSFLETILANILLLLLSAIKPFGCRTQSTTSQGLSTLRQGIIRLALQIPFLAQITWPFNEYLLAQSNGKQQVSPSPIKAYLLLKITSITFSSLAKSFFSTVIVCLLKITSPSSTRCPLTIKHSTLVPAQLMRRSEVRL